MEFIFCLQIFIIYEKNPKRRCYNDYFQDSFLLESEDDDAYLLIGMLLPKLFSYELKMHG